MLAGGMNDDVRARVDSIESRQTLLRQELAGLLLVAIAGISTTATRTESESGSDRTTHKAFFRMIFS